MVPAERRSLFCVLALIGLAGGCATAVMSPDEAKEVLRPHDILYRPEGKGPSPAVILLHGCVGVTANDRKWAGWLRDDGYVALVIDSLTGRGLSTEIGRQDVCGGGALWGSTRVPDVVASLAYLRTLPFVDPNRIGVMGWSHGGWTVLDFLSAAPPEDARSVKATIAFYPYCGFASKARRNGWTADTPLLMLMGEVDAVTPAKPCIKVAEEQNRHGRPVAVKVYPGAGHAFDYDIPPAEAEAAKRILGFTLAYHPAAAADARERVHAFLARHLR